MKPGSLPVTAFLYFSVATLLAQAGALAAIWLRGGFTEDRYVEILAIAHDVDTIQMWNDRQKTADALVDEQVSYDKILAARAQTNVDLDLREMAFDKGWIDIRNLEVMFGKDRDRYKELNQDFERQLAQMREGAEASSVQQVQRQLESIDPKLAKDQILRILNDKNIPSDERMQFVVAVFKGTSLDRRKRILATFRDDDVEFEQLHEILRQIRLGAPEVPLIRDTRQILERFQSES